MYYEPRTSYSKALQTLPDIYTHNPIKCKFKNKLNKNQLCKGCYYWNKVESLTISHYICRPQSIRYTDNSKYGREPKQNKIIYKNKYSI